MKDVILLTKILFKSSKSNTKKKFKKKSDLFFTIIIFLFIYAYLAGVIGYISYEAIKSLILVGKETIFLNIVFCGAIGYSVFQSIFSALNVLFFSKDLDSLLPLPIKPIKIVMAKFNCLIISQYIMYAVVLLPILVVYGYLLKFGILFYIYILLTLLVFPVIPVVITSLLVTIIMKFTNIIKNKETVQYLAVRNINFYYIFNTILF
jgi:ABC-2 type transport system permease protein